MARLSGDERAHQLFPRDLHDLRKGLRKHEDEFGFELTYRWADHWMCEHWDRCQSARLAKGLATFLFIWNRRYYLRPGWVDVERIKGLLETDWDNLRLVRTQRIHEYQAERHRGILFPLLERFLRATKVKRTKGVSPVSMAKGLHMLAPGLFPLWDGNIASYFLCHNWGPNPYGTGKPAEAYLTFMSMVRLIVLRLRPWLTKEARKRHTCELKVLDEYYYIKGQGKDLKEHAAELRKQRTVK